jgi:NitT/TauT family transport system substrate-binding protein
MRRDGTTRPIADLSRRQLLGTAGAAIAGLALSGCADDGAETSGGVFHAQAAVTHLTALLHAAPLHIARQLGYYKAEKLDIEHVNFTGGSETIHGMAGRIGFGMPASLPLLIAYEKGRTDLRIIGSEFNAASVDFVVPASSRIKSPKDLGGTKIAVSAPGSNSYYFAERTVREAGYQVGKDVQVVNVGGAPDSWTAASKGVVDVAWSASPLLDELVVSGKARVVWRSRDYVNSWVDTCLAVRDRFLSDNKDPMQRWVKAVSRAIDLINNQPDQAAAAYAAAVKISPKAAKSALTSWPKGTWSLDINMAGLQENARAGQEQGQLKKPAPLDKIVVRDLVEAV